MIQKSIQRLLTGALRQAGGGAGAFFLVDGGELSLEFANRPVRMQTLSHTDRTAVIEPKRAEPFQVRELAPQHAEAWQAAAPWGRLFVPVLAGGQPGWMAAIVLAEAAFDPHPEFSERLQLWAALAYTRRLLHGHLRVEQERRAELSAFLHHDLLQRSLFLKQRLLDSGTDLADAFPHLDETVELIKQEVEKQRPILINQGIYFALQKLATEARSRGIDLVWGSDFEPVEHPFTGEESAAGIYAIAAALIEETQRSAFGKPVEMRLERPTVAGRKLRLSIAHTRLSDSFSTALAFAFEMADMIGALAETRQAAAGRIHYSFEI